MHSLQLHQHLVGRQGSRGELNTPVLLVDVDALDRNIAKMAAFAAAKGIALRPHAKTHKSAAIARRQIQAGGLGVCCAKLGEAEALSSAGIDDILITSPVVGPPAVVRLAALAGKARGLMAAVDHPDAVAALAATGATLSLVVDIDPGIQRTGVAAPEAALILARLIDAAPNLTFAGVQFYCGLEQHIPDFARRREVITERTDYLKGIISLLARNGMAPRIVTGGGTGTHSIDGDLGVLNELQVGSYVFMDREYADCDLVGDGSQAFETSLLVDARVISANHPAVVTLDAGIKAFATEAGPPPVFSGAPVGSKYMFAGDEHGKLIAPDGVAPPALGEVVTFAAPHCDPTVNLYEAYHVVRGDTLVDIWGVDARGRSA
jgi:D-serine deaminase-like pyridoxal phosphate-dependent protein